MRHRSDAPSRSCIYKDAIKTASTHTFGQFNKNNQIALACAILFIFHPLQRVLGGIKEIWLNVMQPSTFKQSAKLFRVMIGPLHW
ncbi:hypothetical protein SAMN04515666_1123 [Bosea lupini]|uniref:Uncharacterized protein n=1 Tax=Bosea lupini TaxID=1036779 RepID=A0A1H7YKA9_9HYPH|nr:hypothetical protein SAMN04515666_1123 [Bosea lupini]